MIKYIKGNLFDTEANIIAHGCNCQNGFGAGVAGQIAKKYPNVKEQYHDKYLKEEWTLGEIQIVKVGDNKVIINCATQDYFFPRNIVHANYPAIKECMKKVKEYAMTNNQSIAIPKIGAGLAGGDWNIIEKILQEMFTDYDVTVYHLD